MKIIHTGDWHIGKLVHGIHMTEDQRFILNQLVDLVGQEKPDVLLIAGDIYDRSIPPVEAVELLDEVLSRILIQHQTKVIAIVGNHDNPDRVAFASRILQKNGLYLVGNLANKIEPIVLEDEHGKVDFYAIPYTDPAIVRSLKQDKKIKDHNTAMQAILADIINDLPEKSRSICIAHGFISNGEQVDTTDSERPLAIGGTEIIDVDCFQKFNYVALGHLHKAQKVKHNFIRYSGSLMKYSFSEVNHRKTVTIVDMDASGEITINQKELDSLRDMRIIEGKLAELISKSDTQNMNHEDYILARLTDRGELYDAIGKLRTVYPNVLKIERKSFEREAGENRTLAGRESLKKAPLELFREFYENISEQKFNEDKNKVVKELLTKIEVERRKS